MDKMEAVLGEIKTGIEGIVAEQKNTSAKFIDLERDSKGMGDMVKTLDGRIVEIEKYLLERKAGVGVSLPGVNEGKQKFSFAKAMVGTYFQSVGQSHMWKDIKGEFELEVLSQATKKALDTGTSGSGGGYVIPQEYVAEIIELLRAKTTVIQAGATVLEGLNGSPVRIPKQTGAGTVYWVGQNSTVTASDATFGEVQLTPKTMAMRTQFSNLLNILSNPAIETLIRNDFAKQAALELDRVALRGSGSSNQPTGIVNISGIGSYAIGTNGGDYTRQDALKHMGVVDDANALDGKLGFITNPKVRRVLMNERIAQYSGQTSGAYTMLPISLEQLKNMLGYDMFTSTQIPVNLTKGTSSDCAEVYFGNWQELIIGMWGAMEILATNVGGNAWTQNAIEVRLVQNVDIQVRHKESFAVCADARTNNA